MTSYLLLFLPLISDSCNMAEGFGGDGEAENSATNDDENYLDKPMPKQLTSLFGNIIVSSASKAVGAVEAGASYVIAPIVSPPNVWPDMDNIDNLVNVLTVTGYAFTAFSLIGTTYFFTRSAREVWQWRNWAKYRRQSSIFNRQRMASTMNKKKQSQ